MNQPHDFVVLLPFVFIVVCILMAVLLGRAQKANRSAALRAVAATWRGTVIEGGWFGHSHAELQVGGAKARLQHAKEGKRNVTEFTIHFPDPRLRMEIYPQTVVEQVKKFLGMQDIEVGVPRFDELFIVQGNDSNLIREYLSFETQAALQAVARCSYFFDLHLTIGGGTLRVTKRSDIRKVQDLLRLVQSCETLFIALVSARNLGIEFLPTTAPPRISETHCQVCGEGLQGSIVYCTRCQTPHHLDCWQYVGTCSVYACGQKRYRPAKR